jgi:hypothetical protein
MYPANARVKVQTCLQVQGWSTDHIAGFQIQVYGKIMLSCCYSYEDDVIGEFRIWFGSLSDRMV